MENVAQLNRINLEYSQIVNLNQEMVVKVMGQLETLHSDRTFHRKPISLESSDQPTVGGIEIIDLNRSEKEKNGD